MLDGGSDGGLLDLIDAVVRGRVAAVETSMPGVVAAFDASASPPRVDVRLAVKGLEVANSDGDLESYEMPTLRDVPVLYPGGGGASIYWPLEVGDPVTVIFFARDTDNALETGEAHTEPASPRRHDLMDAAAVPLAWSRPGATPLAARGAALVLNHDLIKLGSAATEFATTADKVATALSTLVTWLNSHTHPVSGSATLTPTTPAVAPTAASMAASKVKIE